LFTFGNTQKTKITTLKAKKTKLVKTQKKECGIREA
jgi:hypothetical protein